MNGFFSVTTLPWDWCVLGPTMSFTVFLGDIAGEFAFSGILSRREYDVW